jgi:hypothetical protein
MRSGRLIEENALSDFCLPEQKKEVAQHFYLLYE